MVVRNQSESLIFNGIDVHFFLITKSGFFGYFMAIKPLIKTIKANKKILIHSHYSLSAFVSTIALFFIKNTPTHIVSLMGSDAKSKGWKRYFIRLFSRKYWTETIVKSVSMAQDLKLINFKVIPNGVDLSKIKFNDEINESNINTILFAADPSRYSKNFPLAKRGIKIAQLSNEKIELLVKYNLQHIEIIDVLTNSSCLLLSSRWEGSPNIIKEAMACNIPIVATNVGDVNWLLNGLDGCFVVEQNENEIAKALIKAIDFSNSNKKTKGRERIIKLGLDSQSISNRISNLYTDIND